MPREGIRSFRSSVDWSVSDRNPVVAPSTTLTHRSNRPTSLIETVIACFYQTFRNLPTEDEVGKKGGKKRRQKQKKKKERRLQLASSCSDKTCSRIERYKVQIQRETNENVSMIFTHHVVECALLFNMAKD